ncbi:MAG: acyl carrier protein [Magnetococcales bacterium]|nr:acyl carrier protein [Magnetococcales bacterium]
MEAFLEQLAEILDTDVELTAETVLATIEEWDSLAWLHFMTLADETYGKQIKGKDLAKCTTIQELYRLVT